MTRASTPSRGCARGSTASMPGGRCPMLRILPLRIRYGDSACRRRCAGPDRRARFRRQGRVFAKPLGSSRLFGARRRHGRRDDDADHGRARSCRACPAPAILASPCSSPILRGMSARMRATAAFICPADWLREMRVDREAFLADPRFECPHRRTGQAPARPCRDALFAVPQSAFAAFPCYAAGDACRADIYREIGRALDRSGHDSINRRSVVSGRRKLALLLGALARTPLPRRRSPTGRCRKRLFVEAVIREPYRAPGRLSASDRIGFMIEIVGRIEAGQRMSAARGSGRSRRARGLDCN